MKRNSGMSLVEVMIVMAIFSLMVLVINGVIVSAQNLWSSSSAFSKLEDDALIISRQIAGDLEKSAVMLPPAGCGLTYTDLLPHITETGGDETDGYYGDNITCIVPTYDANGQPVLAVTADSLGVDWLHGNVISYTLETINGKKSIVRRYYPVNNPSAVKEDIMTKEAVSITFRDKETDFKLPYYVVKWSFVLQRIGIAKRKYTVTRQGEVYLRNSRGAEDLYGSTITIFEE